MTLGCHPARRLATAAGRPARQQRWRIGIQRQFRSDLLLDVSYNGAFARIPVSQPVSFLPQQYWATGNVPRWHPITDEVQEVVSEIMAKWGKLVDHRKDRSRADPFIIATAKVLGATVVTDEKHGSAKDPRIPYVCVGLDVRCVDVYKFVRETGLTGA